MCVAANAVVVSCISVAKVAKWWCDCGMFCRGCGGFYVLFRRLQGLFAVKMRCGNGKMWCGNGEMVVYLRMYMLDFLHFGCQGGEMVVRLRRLRGAVAVEIHCVTAVAWCVSGVSNHDFPNFTKHSTVLTSILQQINTLYQHFQSAKTALPALEQAKTMLKIALHTFKNDETHTQNSKIHTQNSICEVRCCENSVRKQQNICGVRRFHD